MILSALLHLAAHTTPALRRLGLVGESIALASRARRQRKAWAPHEAACHAVIERVIAALPHHRKVVVLGSGLLRDVPVATLLARFQQVVLVDAVHLPHIRWHLRKQHITWLTRDLSGVANWLTGEMQGREAPVQDLAQDSEIDLVISANLLSQLPIQPEDWLDRHPGRAKALPTDLLHHIIAGHLEDLAAFPCPVCLLTDVEMIERDQTGATTDTLDLMRGVALPAPDATWEWLVAPRGEIDHTHSYHHRVFAYENLRQSIARTVSAT